MRHWLLVLCQAPGRCSKARSLQLRAKAKPGTPGADSPGSVVHPAGKTPQSMDLLLGICHARYVEINCVTQV